MDDLRTARQRELQRLRNEQRQDLGALRSAGVKAFLAGTVVGVEDAANAELAVRREAHSRRSGAVAQVMEALFAHIDSRAAIDVSRRLHGVSKSTQAIVEDLRNELNEFEPPVLDADRLGPYVVLIEAADLVADDLVADDLVPDTTPGPGGDADG